MKMTLSFCESSSLELYHFFSCVRPSRFVDVSSRSFSLCCDLLSRVCHTAVTYCKDALENHLHVIVGTLIPLVDDQMEVQGQVLPQILFAEIFEVTLMKCSWKELRGLRLLV